MSVIADFLAPSNTHPMGKFLDEYPGVSVDVERIVPVGGSTHYVWISGEDYEDFIEELREDPGVGDLVTVDELPDRVLVRFDWERVVSPIFRLADDVGAIPMGVRRTREGWAIRLRFSDRDDLGTFSEGVHNRGVPLELRQTYEPNGGTRAANFGLTRTQVETLARAYDAGYFEVPREITLAELADELGISEQAVSERLRRGLRALLASTTFDDDSITAEPR